MKAINAIPGEQEQSSPGGAPGQANARDEEAEEISATCISLAAACRAERGLSVAFGGSPKCSHLSQSWHVSQPQGRELQKGLEARSP